MSEYSANHENGREPGPVFCPPGLNPELKPLEVFVGRWKTVGKQRQGRTGSEAGILAYETWEWVAGGYFLEHRFEGEVGNTEASCVEIIGYDSEQAAFEIQSYYNNGTSNNWSLRNHARRWTVTGEWESGGSSAQVKCEMRFSEDFQTFTSKWDYSYNGVDRTSFWEVTSTKVR